MTPDEIKHKIDIDDIEITLADNGGWYWLRLERAHGGHTYRHTVKIDIDPSDSQIIDAGDVFRFWWAETIGEAQVRF